MQLVAYGAQDIYLTGNPMITYFKVVYRRHTNFAMESIEQTFNGTANFGNKVSCLISRNGDLIHGIYMQATLPNLTSASGEATSVVRWTDNVGHFLIKQVDLEIGGQLIDRQYGDWLEIWSQLTVPAGQKRGYLEMIGQDPVTSFGQPTGLQGDLAATGTINGRTIYVPLQFWFCRNVGLALPLIALQYHEVKVNLEFRAASELFINHSTTTLDGQATASGVGAVSGGLTSASLWVDYIYLDTDERRRFAQVSHEYLIEQLQWGGEDVFAGSSGSVVLNFNHPVKELIWVSQDPAATDLGYNQWCNYTDTPAVLHSSNAGGLDVDNLGTIVTDTSLTTGGGAEVATNIRSFMNQSMVRPPNAGNQIDTAKLILNGHDRFATRPGSYFNLVQCRDHHTNVPASPGINVYSFALKPEDHQPSGTCNFSRIDNAKLQLVFKAIRVINDGSTGVSPEFGTSHRVRVYAVNYNVLRVMSGMAGLAYSN